MSARKRIFASKRGEVASTCVSRTVEVEATLDSYRSAMKRTAPGTIYGIPAEPHRANCDLIPLQGVVYLDFPSCLSDWIFRHSIDQPIPQRVPGAELLSRHKDFQCLWLAHQTPPTLGSG